MEKDTELLTRIWGLYQVYDTTSCQLKTKITRTRSGVILLTILAAISGVLGSQFPEIKIYTVSIFGMLSALSFGFATYLSKELIKSAREKKHIIARSAAEALKSETYLFATGSNPYNTVDTNNIFFEKTKNIRQNTEDILLANLNEQAKTKDLLTKPMTVDEYIDERVNDQIHTYYYPKSQANGNTLSWWNQIVFLCSLAGIALASLGAFNFSEVTAAWVAVIGTITASISAYVFAGRFNYLSLSYQSTALHLEDHLTKWKISDQSEQAKSDFITACENTISIENRAWMIELSKKAKPIVPDKPINES